MGFKSFGGAGIRNATRLQNKPFQPIANIKHSLRFNSVDVTNLDRTPTVTGDRFLLSFRALIKRASLDTDQYIFSAGDTNQNFNLLNFTSAGTLRYFERDGGVDVGEIETDSVFRDTAAWYDILFVYDSNNGSSINRVRFYVNGVRQDATRVNEIESGRPTQFNHNKRTAIGARSDNNSDPFDGYMADVYLLDGIGADPTDFGELKDGVWFPYPTRKGPKTFGTNGFHLDFKDSSNFGFDISGQRNDYTANNFTTNDQVLDSPTNNYPIGNFLRTEKSSLITFLNGSLDFSTTAGGDDRVTSTFPIPEKGKWYLEVSWTSVASNGTSSFVGLISRDGSNQYSYFQNGSTTGLSGASYSSYTGSDVIGVKYDSDNDTIEFTKNGVSQGAPVSVSPSKPLFLECGNGDGLSTVEWTTNFGQLGFDYDPGDSFLPITSQNLPAPRIHYADQYFKSLVWEGDNNSPRKLTTGFPVDLAIIKNRSNTNAWRVGDSVRGPDQILETSSVTAEQNIDRTFLSFDDDGITIGNRGEVNGSAGNFYVGYFWRKGVGFDIVSYTGNGSVRTIDHNLNKAPAMMMIKDLSVGNGWVVYHQELGATQYLQLNDPDGATSFTGFFNDTEPTASSFTLGNAPGINGNGNEYIAYLWSEIPGFSRFGTYTGNGSTDGPFVSCGFRPAFILWKNTTESASWEIIDTARDTHNPTDVGLFPHTNVDESTSRANDFVSNGFKPRNNNNTRNDNGDTYVFAAFAEHPFKYSNAR
jgi:hypothetical protein